LVYRVSMAAVNLVMRAVRSAVVVSSAIGEDAGGFGGMARQKWIGRPAVW
jgi:hypothetical protein